MRRMLDDLATCARKHLDSIQPRPVLQSNMEETTLDTGLEVAVTDLTGTA